NFNTAANWDDDTVPGAADVAQVNNGGTALITQDNTLQKLQLGGAASSSGYVEMTAGILSVTSDFFVGSASGSRGGLILSGGTINVAGQFSLAQATSNSVTVGVVRQTGGSLIQSDTSTAWNRIARYGDGYAYYGLSGGDLQLANGYFGGNSTGDGVGLGVGMLHQTGGTFTINGGNTYGLRLSNSGGSIGIYNLTGGTGRVQTGGINVARNGGYSPLGVINIGGTGQLTIDYQGVTEGGADIGFLNVGVTSSGGRASDGVVNLATGGVLTAPLIYSGDGVTEAMAGNASLNFHGGTLVTNANQADYLRLMDAYVYSEGAKIDTAGHDVTINRALLAPGGYGVASVELATAGAGSGYDGPPAVRITGGSGTGATAVATVANGEITGITVTNPGSGYQEGDTLTAQLWGGGPDTAAKVDSITLGVNVASGGLQKLGLGTLTLAGANTYTGPTSVEAGGLDIDGSITSDVAVAAAASLSGTGTIDGNVGLDGVLAVAFNSDADTIDKLAVTGNLDLTEATISFSDLGVGELDLGAGAYVFATYGTLVGRPVASLGVPAGWTIDYAHGEARNAIALVAVPEPATLALLAGLVAVFSVIRVRR
ncbi:MAG: PEP-CTERM sorting domain-containing protein, partial [Pirellulaceae bacterium]|nr:PEP-CTERM sorting domain-containing protein [Pirellulaceae bacterium]